MAGWVVPVVPVPAIPLSFSAEIVRPAAATARIIDPETGEKVVIPLPPGTTVIDGEEVPVENTGTTGPGSTAKYRSASLAEVWSPSDAVRWLHSAVGSEVLLPSPPTHAKPTASTSPQVMSLPTFARSRRPSNPPLPCPTASSCSQRPRCASTYRDSCWNHIRSGQAIASGAASVPGPRRSAASPTASSTTSKT
jgi:hypothetical protein